MPVPAMDLILGQKSVSGSSTALLQRCSPCWIFAARHKIVPQVEHFPMSKVNDAVEHLTNGKARYRVVLDPDFA